MRWMAVLLAVFAGLYLHERVRADRAVNLQRACVALLQESEAGHIAGKPLLGWQDFGRKRPA